MLVHHVIHVAVINMACKYVSTEMCDMHIVYGHGYKKEDEAVYVPGHISQSPHF